MTTTFKEQWEALVIEADHWKRPREMSKGIPKLDSVDEISVEDKFVREGSGNIDRLETPLARFLKLMYTDQFSDFRERVLEDVNGVSSMSEGVRDMVIDQTFRYFVMVEADPTKATWFAQVIVSIAVFRVNFDEGVIGRLKEVIRDTRQKFFKKTVTTAPVRTIGEIAYAEFRNISYPTFLVNMLESAGEISHFRNHMIRSDTEERDLKIEHVNMIQALEQNKIHAVVGDAERELYLHLVQLNSLYRSPDSKMVVYYYSKQAQKFQTLLNSLAEMMTIHVNHQGPVNSTEADVFVMLTDDGVNMDDFNSVSDALGMKLVAYSFKVGLEAKKMKIPGGRVINTPWKPPHEPHCRMVWEPTDLRVVFVDRTLVRSHHVIQDLFMRPFAKYETRLQNSKIWEGNHLIRGEFDSELEVYILESANLKGVPEIMDAARLMVPPRAVLFHPDFRRGMLEQFVDFVLKRHTASVRNSTYAMASRCSRMGVYPPMETDKTEQAKAIQTVFGKNLEDGLKMFEDYMKLEGSRVGLIETIRMKNIFPMVSVKQSILPEILSIFDGDIKKLGEMVSSEVYSDDQLYEEVVETFFRIKGNMNLVVLGESLGNTVHQFISQYGFRDREVREVIGEMGPRMESMWKYIGGEEVKYRSAKNIVEVLEYLEGSRTPFTVLVAKSYPGNISAPFIKKFINSERLVGVYTMENMEWTPGHVYEPVFSRDVFSEEAFMTGESVRSCMVLGNGISLSRALKTNITTLTAVLTDLTESKIVSSIVGKLNMNGVDSEVFIENVIDNRFVTPTPGTVYDLAIVSPLVTRGLSGRDLKNLVTRIREEVISYAGEIKMLIADEAISDLEKMLPYREIMVSRESLSEMKGGDEDRGEFDEYFVVSIHREIPSAVERYQGRDLNTGENVRAYNNFVKNSIINRFLEMFDKKTSGGRATVLDLGCGKGQDINKWKNDRFKIGYYLGFDGSSKEIEEANRRYKSIRGYKPEMRFVVADIFGSGDWAGRLVNKYDVVSCQLAIHYAFGTERTIKSFLHNVSQSMPMEGSFLVTTLDSDKVTQRIREGQIMGNDMKVSRGRYYVIEAGINTLRAIEGQVEAGVEYIFTQFPDSDNPRTTTEFLVDRTYFERLCREQGMEIIRRKNFTEYMGSEFTKEIDADELKLVELYCTYEILKVKSPEAPSAKQIPALKKEFYNMTENLVEGVRDRNMDVLIFAPEHIKSFPAFRETKSVTVLTQDIDFLRIPPGGTNVKIILENDLAKSESYLRSQTKFDRIYLPGTVLAEMDERDLSNLLSATRASGQILGSFVSSRSAYSGRNAFLVPDEKSFLLNGDRFMYVDMESLKTSLKGMGADINIYQPPTSNEDLKIFSSYIVKLAGGGGAQEQTASQSDEGVSVEENTVNDKFILSTDQKKQKASPGDNKINEFLGKNTQKNKYTNLSKIGNWRQLLADTWEGPEFVINDNESFKSIEHAILHFKGRVRGVEGFEAFNAMTQGSIPEGKADREAFMKPFRAVAMSSKSDKARLEEYKQIIYEAKFRTGVYRQALLETQDAHLYINTNTRNTLLEEVRSIIRAIVTK